RSRRVAMERQVTGFHQDEEGHRVAELECGHNQHVRHDPPWECHPWGRHCGGLTMTTDAHLSGVPLDDGTRRLAGHAAPAGNRARGRSRSDEVGRPAAGCPPGYAWQSEGGAGGEGTAARSAPITDGGHLMSDPSKSVARDEGDHSMRTASALTVPTRFLKA